MFCPRCATENTLEKGYCRQCGQRLTSVRLALEGTSEQSLAGLRAGEKWVSAGSATLLAFNLIGLIIGYFSLLSRDLGFGYIALVNLLLGSLIGLPIVYFGKARIRQARRLLTGTQDGKAQVVVGYS